jgi:hypothetical protein
MKFSNLKILLVFILIMVLTGCSTGTTVTPVVDENQPEIQTSIGMSATQDGASIRLDWEPLSGAENYLLEILLADGSTVPVAYLSASSTSYQDSMVMAETEYTYRLTAISSGERGEVRQVKIKTLPSTKSPIQIAYELDQLAAVFDTSFLTDGNFDPTNLDPSMFTNMFPTDEAGAPILDGSAMMDPSSFIPQQIESTELIGPQGGEVSVTSSSGVKYTLSIPQDALRMEIPVTMQPVSSISNSPLSGGMNAAVIIEPAGMSLDIPATLTITPSESAANSTSTELIVTGFAFQPEDGEFYLYPQLKDGSMAGRAVHLAKLAMVNPQAGPLAEIARLQIESGGGYGVGSGTASDIKSISQKSPSTSRQRTTQQAAVAELDELAPLFPPEELAPIPNLPPEAYSLAKIGEGIMQQAGRANDWSSFMETLENFRVYMNSGGDKYNKGLNEKILDSLVQIGKNLLEKNKGECLTPDDYKAQDLVERLINPKDKFSRSLSERFIQKFGQQLLDDLAMGKKACSFELDIKSSLTLDSNRSTLHVSAEATKIPLQLTYRDGEIYLWGSKRLKLKTQLSGICSSEIKQYDSLDFVVDRLDPVYEGQKVKDLVLRSYGVVGWQKLTGARASSDKDCPQFITISGGGDYWTGLFTTARITLDNTPTISHWQVKSGSNANESISASWESVVPSFTPLGSDGNMSEDSKLKFRAIPYKRTRK